MLVAFRARGVWQAAQPVERNKFLPRCNAGFSATQLTPLRCSLILWRLPLS